MKVDFRPVDKIFRQFQTKSSRKKRVLIVRHGQSEGNIKSLFYGAKDYPLTDIGKNQAKLLFPIFNEYYEHFQCFATSNLLRAIQTCQECLFDDDFGSQLLNVRVRNMIGFGKEEKTKRLTNPDGKFSVKPDAEIVDFIPIPDIGGSENLLYEQYKHAQDSNNLERIRLQGRLHGNSTFFDISKMVFSRFFYSLLDSKDFIIDQRFQEFDLGNLENCEFDPENSREDLANFYNSLFLGKVKGVGAESASSFRGRILEGLSDLPDGNSAVFCHSGVLKQFLKLSDYPLNYFGNLGMIVIEFDDIHKETEISGLFYGYMH